MTVLIQKIRYLLKQTLWKLNGYFGKAVSSGISRKVTVLITYYNPMRMKYINHQLRNILKCTFVDKVIVSNHNPEINIDTMVRIDDTRLVILNQTLKRACGYRWRVAKALNTDYLIAIDDDILLFPSQLRMLFEHLVREPEVPHGFSGMILQKNGDFQYREQENINVHYLCEVYAVTKEHVEQYFEMEKILAIQDETLPDAVERLGDFIVISQTGPENPKIHTAGGLFRSETFKMPGIANHKDQEFGAVCNVVARAVDNIRLRSPA